MTALVTFVVGLCHSSLSDTIKDALSYKLSRIAANCPFGINMPTEAIEILKPLIEFESVSRQSNAEISEHIELQMRVLQFETERIEYTDGNGELKVCVIGRRGPVNVTPSVPEAGGMAWFGHTDVVPADNWFSDTGPWKAVIDGDRLYGRGSCDMKGPIACMLAAAARVKNVKLKEPLFITCTADEEIGYFGARAVVERSQHYREMVERRSHAIIGEPTLLQVVHAHKGSVGFRVVSHGKAAHSSTHDGINANLAMIPFLQEMKAIHDQVNADPAWQDDRFDPPTLSWNIGINDHTAAVNITAPHSICTVYFRPMPDMDESPLLERTKAAAEKHGLEFQPMFGGAPLYTAPDSHIVKEVLELTGNSQPQTVCYGTDGAEFSELEKRVVCGPGDIAQAHTKDEWIALEQLAAGTDLYERMIRRWCVAG